MPRVLAFGGGRWHGHWPLGGGTGKGQSFPQWSEEPIAPCTNAKPLTGSDIALPTRWVPQQPVALLKAVLPPPEAEGRCFHKVIAVICHCSYFLGWGAADWRFAPGQGNPRAASAFDLSDSWAKCSFLTEVLVQRFSWPPRSWRRHFPFSLIQEGISKTMPATKPHLCIIIIKKKASELSVSPTDKFIQ